jgi:GT2 family glycosyltransferase
VDATRVAVVIVPRERLGWRGMDAYFEHSPAVGQLIYVDAGAPRRLRRQLEVAGRERGFDLVVGGRFLTPNEARNEGLSHVRGDIEYVVYLDNDVYVEPGWLDHLVECAEETGAAVVGPLTCEGEPLGAMIHAAHGDADIVEEAGSRRLVERNPLHMLKTSEHAEELQRRRCSLVEFHALLVRAAVLKEIGDFDERLLNTREQVDFCLQLAATDHAIWVEPRSVVHFVPGPPFRLADLHYYMLRWNDRWEQQTLRHFREKWRLDEDEQFARRLRNPGRRRHFELLRPLALRVTPGGRGAWRLERTLRGPERLLNRWVTWRGVRRRGRVSP